ncbi:MAG: hypothetical protein ACLFNM_00705 [Candidatus Woesearchaeota archaeon]
MKLVLKGIAECLDVVKKDIKELIHKDSYSEESLIFIDDCSIEEASILAYRCQSIYALGIVVSKQDISSSASDTKHEEAVFATMQKGSKKDATKIIHQGSSFKIQTIKCVQEKETCTTTYNAAIGSAVSDFAQKNNMELCVDLDKPDLVFTYFVQKEQSILCLDLIGDSLHKRPYKIFSQSNSLNSVLAYCFAKLSGAKQGDTFVDCCCGSGIIPIEVAQQNTKTSSFVYEQKFMGLRYPLSKEAFENTQKEIKNRLPAKKESQEKIFGFDYNFTNITNAKKNAKLAGIHEVVSFSKVALDWIDAKFDKGEVDVLAGNLPKLSQRTKNEKDIKKFLDELFYQARFIVKPKGFVSVLFNNKKLLEDAGSRHGFTVIEERIIRQGEQEYLFMKFSCPQEPSEE